MPCCRATENFCRKFARISCSPLHSALLNLLGRARECFISLPRSAYFPRNDGAMDSRKKETGFVCHCNRFIKTKWVCVYVVSSHSLHESGPCSMSASLSPPDLCSHRQVSHSVTHSIGRRPRSPLANIARVNRVFAFRKKFLRARNNIRVGRAIKPKMSSLFIGLES